jgi:hypothetical protein
MGSFLRFVLLSAFATVLPVTQFLGFRVLGLGQFNFTGQQNQPTHKADKLCIYLLLFIIFSMNFVMQPKL